MPKKEIRIVALNNSQFKNLLKIGRNVVVVVDEVVANCRLAAVSGSAWPPSLSFSFVSS